MDSVPDLLEPEPCLRLDAKALSQALTFAFAAGGGSEQFDRILDRAPGVTSHYEAECFAKDLFLDDFVARCFPVLIGGQKHRIQRGHLLQLLTHPPDKRQTASFRHSVLTELLENDALRGAAEQALTGIRHLRFLFESGEPGRHLNAIQRRMDILRASRDVFGQLASSFESAESGLRRLADFGRAVSEDKGYRDVCALLDYEENLATVDLRVQVGHDGELRRFEIVRARENADNPFYVSAVRRFFSRLAAIFRGYRLRQAEILGRLADAAFDGIQKSVVHLFQVAHDLEFYFAGLAFRTLAQSKGLSVSLPKLDPVAGGSRLPSHLEIKDLFNPFLLFEERPPVPCDLSIREQAIVVVTGPNSGGKTRLLQALGLAQLLAQVGLFVPARRARLPMRQAMFVSLTQEAASDQREGRLGVELLRIRRMFERLPVGALVILDELCSGTNPSEGEEIFQLVVSLLSELRPQAFITTHFLQFAAELADERPVPQLEFIQVELDAQQHPTYHFVPGVATTSLARQTAERLGVTREALQALVEQAKRVHDGQEPRETPSLLPSSDQTDAVDPTAGE